VARASRRKTCVREKAGALTRREFARHAAAAAAALAALPGSIPLAGAVPASNAKPRTDTTFHPAAVLPQETGSTHPKLSAEALAEADARAAEILRRYGPKLDDEQKADIRRLAREAQVQIEAVRAFPLDNNQEPAAILRLVGTASVRRPAAAAAPRKPAGKGA